MVEVVFLHLCLFVVLMTIIGGVTVEPHGTLHGAQLTTKPTLNYVDVNSLSGEWISPRRDCSSYLGPTRLPQDQVMTNAIAVAAFAQGKMSWIDVDDAHVSLAHAHLLSLREATRHMGIKPAGKLVTCAGRSEAKGVG